MANYNTQLHWLPARRSNTTAVTVTESPPHHANDNGRARGKLMVKRTKIKEPRSTYC